ncbi:MAG TPA: class I SAM-dependent methyltransferase [Planktothrix sp.]
MAENITLEPTAALVIDLAEHYYADNQLTQQFVGYLDTSSGKKMIDEHKSTGIYSLTQECIYNRKYIIREATLEQIRHNQERSQVVILAAGKAPLALELLQREFDKIDRVYEVDLSDLDNKRSIYQTIAPSLVEKVSFYQGDIRSEALFADLSSLGFKSELFTIFVIEGITHYVTPGELRELLARIVSDDHSRHRVVIDFAPPFDMIKPESFERVARTTYGIIERLCYLKPMTKHTAETLSEVFQSLGGEVLHHYTIHDIEKLRTGSNQHFPDKHSGWLEYTVARI